MRNPEHFFPVDGHLQALEDRLRLSADFIRAACPILLNLDNVVPSSREAACRTVLDFNETEIGRLVKNVLSEPIEIILIKGLPGVGKTRVLKDLSRLFTFLGYDVQRIQYDQVLQAVAPLFGPETDAYDANCWYFVSHLLLASIFQSSEIDLANQVQLQQLFAQLDRTSSHDIDQASASQVFANAALVPRGGRRPLVIMEAPAVATVQGKDRGRVAEQILGARERRWQMKGLLGRQVTISLVPHLATMQHAILERNMAVEIDQIMSGHEADPYLLHTLHPYLSHLESLHIKPITSTNYVADLRQWINEQRAAAPEAFIKSMYAEEVARVKAWYLADKPKHRIMRNEVILPPEMSQTLKPAEVVIAKTMAACYEDETLRTGIHPKHMHVVTNKFSQRILER